MTKEVLLIATIKSWNINLASEFCRKYTDKYVIHVVSDPKEFVFNFLSKIRPKYVFILHWSWVIPANIYENFECILFHPTHLPYGRGGSPLQNLIINNQYETKISAFRVNGIVDGGDLYLQEPFSVKRGNAEEMLAHFGEIVFSKLIPKILSDNIAPQAQRGEVVSFSRRTPDQSNLLTSKVENLSDLYDYIRMLDGEGYPAAFINVGKLKIKFYGVSKFSGGLRGIFEVEEKDAE